MIFGYTGQIQSFIAEKDKKYTIDLYGARGGNGGGKGGHVNVVYCPTANNTLYFYVGGQGGLGGGGWNGGGNGGQGYNTDEFTGYSGGGATDIRIGGTVLSSRVIVAGGGGADGLNGGSTGGAGGEYPYNTDGDINWNNNVDLVSCGGMKGGITGGGAGGVAPTYVNTGNGSNTGTWYLRAGGGGGGGYYGGGGGSSGVIVGTANYTGVAGTAGSLGVGGNGGGRTSGASGDWSQPSGGGGGGSSYVNSSYSGILSYCFNTGVCHGDGEGHIFEILSKPIIEKVEKVDDKINFIINKDVSDNDLSEKFYYNMSIDDNNFKIDRSNGVIIGNIAKTVSYTISSTIVGYHTVYFKICNGLGEMVETSDTFYIGEENKIALNLQNKEISQGHFLTDFITDLGTETVEKQYETKIIINGKQYGKYQIGNQVYLPLLYDGVLENEVYDLQISSRVGKLLTSENGVKKYQWSNWVTSEVIEVEPTIAPYNNLTFTCPLVNQAIEKDSFFIISWQGLENKRDSVKYIVDLYKDGEKILTLYEGDKTEFQSIANLTPNLDYQLGLTLVREKKYKSVTTFSEKFKVTSIQTESKIQISNELKLTTSLEEGFNKIKILINNEYHKTLGNNVQNEQLPLWKMEKGTNNIAIRVFLDEKYYLEQNYQVALHVAEGIITPINQYNIESYCSLQDDSSYTLMSQGLQECKWGEVEQEYGVDIEQANPIEEINQKIAIKKIDNLNSDSTFKGIQILGQID